MAAGLESAEASPSGVPIEEEGSKEDEHAAGGHQPTAARNLRALLLGHNGAQGVGANREDGVAQHLRSLQRVVMVLLNAYSLAQGSLHNEDAVALSQGVGRVGEEAKGVGAHGVGVRRAALARGAAGGEEEEEEEEGEYYSCGFHSTKEVISRAQKKDRHEELGVSTSWDAPPLTSK